MARGPPQARPIQLHTRGQSRADRFGQRTCPVPLLGWAINASRELEQAQRC
jgi:hypothetical protein